VVEVDEVRQVVDLDPRDRQPAPEAGAHRLQVWAIRPDLGVAVDARLARRNARTGRLLDRGVAVAAIDTELTGVVLVAELDGLRARDRFLGHVRRPVDEREHPERRGYQEHGAEETQS